MKINFSVRTLFVFLAVSFTTIPVLLFGVYEGRTGVARANQQARDLNRGGAQLIGRDIGSSVNRFKALFEALAAGIDVQTLRFKDEARPMELLKKYPQVAGILILNDKAISVASYSTAGNTTLGVDYSDIELNIRVSGTHETAISGNLMGRVSGRASILFAVPIIGPGGSLAGILSGAVPTPQFRTEYELVPEQFAIVVDGFGRLVSSMNAKDGDTFAAAFATTPLGNSRVQSGEIDADVSVVEVEPIGWRVVLGFPHSYVMARAREAIRSAALVGFLCALIGVFLAGGIAFATIRALDHVIRQIQEMSAADLRSIQLSEKAAYPRELRTLIGNFNNLLDRTARTRQAEFDAISQVADTILIVRPDGQITYVNDAGSRRFGDVVGGSLMAVVGRDSAETILSPDAPRDWKGDLSLHKIDGSSFDAFLSSTSILEDNKLNSVVVIVQDITHEKAARDEVVQSEKMITLGELVAGTSHELNNPLAIVTGYCDLMLDDGAKLDTEQRLKIESIRKNALRASNVVHSLLAFARKRKPERVRTHVNVVVDAALELKDYDLRTSGIRVEKQLTPGLPPIFADPHQIEQVLLNILNNAQDAVLSSSSSPAITIRTSASAGSVLIRVLDSGAGIPKSDLKKVFDPFFTTKPIGKGTGLGLSISYGIIREHGGEIRIESRVGGGTEVLIELPIGVSDPASAVRVSADQAKNSGKRFLVVDDEPDMAAILKVGFSRRGHVVDTAYDIESAMALARKEDYEFIITDMKMPGGSGIDLFNHLCAIDSSYRNRFVFLTGDTSNPATIQFLEKESLPYFSKPFDLETMNEFFAKRGSRPKPD